MIRKFEVKCRENGICKDVFIDGKQVTGITRCDISLVPNEIPKVTLEYNSFIVNFEADSVEVTDNR